MLHQRLQQPLELAAFAAREWGQEGVLGGLEALLQALEGGGAGGGEADDLSAPAAGVAAAGDEVVGFHLTKEGVKVAVVDPEAPAELGLARRALLGERGEDREVLAAGSLLRQLRDEDTPRSLRCSLAGLYPAKEQRSRGAGARGTR